MFEFLALMTFGGWFATAAFFGFLIWSTIDDFPIITPLAIFVYGMALAVFTDIDVWGGLTTNVGFLIVFVLAYLAVGAGYALVRWRLYCGDEDAQTSIKVLGVGAFTASKKSKIINWWINWPLSAIGFFCWDALQWAGTGLYNMSAGLFVSIAKNAAGVKD